MEPLKEKPTDANRRQAVTMWRGDKKRAEGLNVKLSDMPDPEGLSGLFLSQADKDAYQRVLRRTMAFGHMYGMYEGLRNGKLNVPQDLADLAQKVGSAQTPEEKALVESINKLYSQVEYGEQDKISGALLSKDTSKVDFKDSYPNVYGNSWKSGEENRSILTIALYDSMNKAAAGLSESPTPVAEAEGAAFREMRSFLQTQLDAKAAPERVAFLKRYLDYAREQTAERAFSHGQSRELGQQEQKAIVESCLKHNADEKSVSCVKEVADKVLKTRAQKIDGIAQGESSKPKNQG